MTSNKELIALIRAEINGEAIQQNERGNWVVKNGFWDSRCDYRIKPKEWYLVVANTPTDGWAKAYTDKQSAAMEMFENSHIEKVRGVEDDK